VLSLGYFTSEIEAAMTYDKVASIYFQDYAYLNFPTTAQPITD